MEKFKTLTSQINTMEQYRNNAQQLSQHLKHNKAVEVNCGNVQVKIPSYALQPLIEQLIDALNNDINDSTKRKLTLN